MVFRKSLIGVIFCGRMTSSIEIDEEGDTRGSMRDLDQRIDQPMDEEAGNLKNMYREKVGTTPTHTCPFTVQYHRSLCCAHSLTSHPLFYLLQHRLSTSGGKTKLSHVIGNILEFIWLTIK